MNWIDTNTLIAICACAIGLTQFLFWRYIAKQKSYESEKGKNLATKEDVAGITKEIESVKNAYNSSLEKYKFDLQKDFESSKFIISLCSSLDETFIKQIVSCKSYMDTGMLDSNGDYSKALNEIYKLARFLLVYRVRYEENECAKQIIDITSEIALSIEFNGAEQVMEAKSFDEKMMKLEEAFKTFLSIILPRFLPADNKQS